MFDNPFMRENATTSKQAPVEYRKELCTKSKGKRIVGFSSSFGEYLIRRFPQLVQNAQGH